jgi:hypothetical protein
LAWTWLNVVANVRFPGEENRFWFLPCIDTVVLFAAFALVTRAGRNVPRPVHVGLALFFVIVRFFRIADGISSRSFHKRFDVYVNLALLPELPRLLRTTLSVWELGLLAVGIVIGMTLVGVLSYAALRVAERSLRERTTQQLFACVSVAFIAFSLLPRAWRERVRSPASSAALRLLDEARSVVHASGAYERERLAVRAARSAFSHMPSNLAHLEGNDVLLFIIESYGEAVFEDSAYAAKIRSEYEAFERELGAQGYGIASNVLESPTFGGCSWFAHAALDTGLRVEDQHAYEALAAQTPLTIADVFRAAGYRTALVQPATERPVTHEYLHFDHEYYAKAFGYRGPELGWGNMPDQFVIDFVQRRELADRSVPHFVEYALVTSHVPWLAEPTVLDDWSSIGDGSVFATLPIKRHATEWSNVDQASDAYLDAIVYDLQVLRHYLAFELQNDTLVVIVGDHQPPGGVTRSSSGRGVPVHVLSRKAALVAPFRARGYAEGMRPVENSRRHGMESFLFSFVRDFSADLRQTSVVGGPTP